MGEGMLLDFGKLCKLTSGKSSKKKLLKKTSERLKKKMDGKKR
jgi:hypothetical protein